MKNIPQFVNISLAQLTQGLEKASGADVPPPGFAKVQTISYVSPGADPDDAVYPFGTDAPPELVPAEEISIPSKLSSLGVQFLGHLENVRLFPYDDLTGDRWDGVSEPEGHLAIGFGRTLFDDMYTEEQMQHWLTQGATPDEVMTWMKEDLIHPTRSVLMLQTDRMRNLKQPPFEQHQFDALVCFVYNIGASAFAKSTLQRKLLVINKDMNESVEEEMPRWKYSRGTKPPGLPKRRRETIELFQKRDYVPNWFVDKHEARALEEQMKDVPPPGRLGLLSPQAF